jgi:LysR family cys regulon transcriptional activator
MDNIDISALKTFIAIMETGNFTAAGKRVNKSQPAVSIKIKSLEENLGVHLFERFGALKVKPTSDALLLKELATPLVKDAGSLKKRFEEARKKSPSSDIRIASHDSVLAYLFPDIVSEFHSKHPAFKFHFIRTGREGIVASVIEGSADLGITTLDTTPRGIVYETYRNHKRMLIIPKGHHLSGPGTPRLKDIAKYPLILPPVPSETRGIIDDIFRKAGLNTELALEIGDRNAVISYVEKGLGISIMADYYLFPQDRTRIAIKDVSSIFGSTTRGVLWRKGKVFSETQKDLIELIRRYEH